MIQNERRDRGVRRGPFFSARSAASAFLLALVFLALHLPYLPSSLEDLDSINFALGVRQFDVAHHQPHPPGYPVFISVAKAVRVVAPSEATALSAVSVAAGALGVLAIAALFRRTERAAGATAWPLAATALAVTSPLYWFTAGRPLSDMAGLAAGLAVQVMTLSASSPRVLAAAAFAAGAAAGLRSQVVWLTVPLLIYRALHHGGHRGHRGSSPTEQDFSSASTASSVVAGLVAYVAGALVWAVPLVAASGGPAAYWHALFDQGAEDLGNIQMLWTRHDPRALMDALYYAFVAPWAAWPMAVAVLVLAAIGLVWALGRAPYAIAWLAVGFGPYLLFDLLFQETFTSRYALPLVIPMAYLAVAGTRVLPGRSGLVVAIALAMFGAHVGGTSIAAYSRQKAPAFRLLDDMRSAARSTREPPVLAMDRRESLDFRRPIAWVGEEMPAVARTLPAPPQHEWLEPVKYWNGGGRAPVWFVVDPVRTSIDLVQHGEPAEYRWALPYPVLMSGVRPNEMSFFRVDRPEWYVGEGWSLTPEAAGVADADRRGLSHGPIEGAISRDTLGGVLLIGGRSFDPTLRPRLAVEVDGRPVIDEVLTPGAFLHVTELPTDLGAADYSKIRVTTTADARVAVEQFDASARRPVLGFGAGWHEQEFNPRTGVRWRWLSERGELRFRSPAPRVTLHLEGESPRTYFSRGSRLIVRTGDRVVFDDSLSSDFSLNIPVANAGETLTLETDQVFAPSDRSRRSADRRHLGLRIFTCELRPARP